MAEAKPPADLPDPGPPGDPSEFIRKVMRVMNGKLREWRVVYMARCKARKRRTQTRCENPAALKLGVCKSHGAGTRARVKAGTRKSPLAGALNAGKPQNLRSSTIDTLITMDPLFKERVQFWLKNKEQLRDHDELLARAWGIVDVISDKVERMGPFGEQAPPLIAAIDLLRKCLELVAKAEGRIGSSTTHIHVNVVNGLVVTVIEILGEFVPPERLDEALHKLGSTRADIIADASSTLAIAGPPG